MKNNKVWKDIQKAFNTGVSYMLPSVVVGGILLAVALATGTACLLYTSYRSNIFS